MKCIIFGGGGFIGSAIADRLLREGHEVRIFERPRVAQYREFSADEKIEWITGDFLNTNDISNAIEGVNVVLHLISTTLPKGSNEDPIYDVNTNVVGTLQLLNAMIFRKVGRIVFISSGGTVYGNPLYLPIDELHPTNPLVSYGVTKLTIEKYLQLYEREHGIVAISLRVANPYGERQRVETAQGAVGVFLHRSISNLPIDIWGDGSVNRDYIHISDVANAFSKAIFYNGAKRVFNVSSGVGTSLNDVIREIECALNKNVVCNYLEKRDFDVPVNILSNELVRREFNWSPAVSLQLGIKITADWMKKQLAR